MIPRIVHYCWLSNDPVPDELKAYMKSWKRVLPEYEFIKWDFSRFKKELSIWVSEAFDKKKYAFACDYIRMYAVYNYGGIYLDMDVEVLKSFNDLLEKEYFFAYENPKQPWIEAGCFGAEKGNDFLGVCLNRYQGRHFVKEDGSLDLLPLPQVMSEVIRQNNIMLDIYPCTFFTAKSYDTGREFPTEETYTIHHFEGSWKTDEEKLLIGKMRRVNRMIGPRIGHNLYDYKEAIKENGIKGVVKLTQTKIKNRKESHIVE